MKKCIVCNKRLRTLTGVFIELRRDIETWTDAEYPCCKVHRQAVFDAAAAAARAKVAELKEAGE